VLFRSSLIELHDGSVEAQSEGLGRGSEFVVRLPVLRDAPAAPEPAALPVAKAVKPRRVLVIDDNRDAAISLARLLKLKGHDPRTANDGLEALELAKEHLPELVFCDIGLPKMNGYEVARRIREEPWGKSAVLIAVTGWGQEEFRQKSKDAGFDGHLVKPVEIATFNELLGSLEAPSEGA
jgi:CheY-like chemotaxis protein